MAKRKIKRRRQRRPNSKAYIKNKDLYNKIVEWQKTKDEKIYEELWEMFSILCNRLATHHWYCNFTYKEDFIQEALIDCIKGLEKFNPEKSKNAFAYFSTVVSYRFQNFIKDERKESVKKDRFYHKYNDITKADINRSFKEIKGYDPDRDYWGT